MLRFALSLPIVLLLGLPCLAEDPPKKDVQGPAPTKASVSQKRITISFVDQDIKEVINQIATFVKVNVIVSPDVKGTVTLKVRDAPWRDVLTHAVGLCGAVLVEESHGIFRVTPRVRRRPGHRHIGPMAGHLGPLAADAPGVGFERHRLEVFLRDAKTETAAKYFVERLAELRERPEGERAAK
jgi:type II secretory pathway component GspD/PulD (secretin)